MSRNSTRFVCLNALSAAAFLCGAAPACQVLDRRTVLIYNDAWIEPKVLAEAEDQASRIFREARIELFWVNCAATEDHSRDSCDEHLKESALIVKVLGSAGPFPNPKSLAYAAVDRGGGRLAMIFLDRIRKFVLQADSSCEFAWMLGHVIAHEMGHLLLSMAGHTPTGIMTADWRTAEMRQMAKGRLLFTPRESTKMRTDVKRRNTALSSKRRP